MSYIIDLINNQALITAIISWFVAQIIKVILVFITTKKVPRCKVPRA